MIQIVIFGGGDIAEKGIVPVVGGVAIPKDFCNVLKPNEIKEILQELNPQVVINCAGVSHVQQVKGGKEYLWIEEVSVNLVGSYYVAKYALEADVKTLIFIASVAGMYGKGYHSGYSASKGGVISLVQSLAMEGHNAYAISPGRVDTKMRQKDAPQDKPGSRMEPIEVGKVVQEILDGKHTPGDNLVVRKVGFVDIVRETDKGEPWKTELKVGQPVTI